MINNRSVFLIILEAGKPQMKTMADLVFSEGLIYRWCLFIVSTSGERDKLGLWDLFYTE